MLEGMLIAMRFAEATEGFIYLREEYATARGRLTGAIDEPGKPVFSTDSRSSSSSAPAPTSAREETAMLESMEGRRAAPRPSLRSRARSATSAARR